MVQDENEVTRERIVAFIDLLAYESILKGERLIGLESIWSLEDVNDRAWSFISLFYEKINDVFLDKSFNDLQLIGFSDGLLVILTADDESGLGRDEIFTFCAKIQELLDLCTADNVPLRGGISIGLVKADKKLATTNMNYMAGLAVSQAVRMEGIQEWVGISFFPPIEMPEDRRRVYCETLEWLSSQNKSPVKRWDIPTKQGLQASFAISFGLVQDAIVKITAFRDEEKAKSGSEENKYRGTLQFLRALQSRNNLLGDEVTCKTIAP